METDYSWETNCFSYFFFDQNENFSHIYTFLCIMQQYNLTETDVVNKKIVIKEVP